MRSDQTEPFERDFGGDLQGFPCSFSDFFDFATYTNLGLWISLPPHFYQESPHSAMPRKPFIWFSDFGGELTGKKLVEANMLASNSKQFSKKENNRVDFNKTDAGDIYYVYIYIYIFCGVLIDIHTHTFSAHLDFCLFLCEINNGTELGNLHNLCGSTFPSRGPWCNAGNSPWGEGEVGLVLGLGGPAVTSAVP